ncbi:MAG: hypothetical protein JSS53_06725, partial [Proteobacteria bacterium]|nr:hypothetical protein [Pseudomonadota bacterium]
MLNLDKEISFTLGSEKDVKEICKPLFNNSSVNFYEYKEVYYDGYTIDLNTACDLVPAYYHENLFPCKAEIEQLSSRYAFFSVLLGTPSMFKEYEKKWSRNLSLVKNSQHAISHRFYIVVQSPEMVEVSAFGTQIPDGKGLEFFMTNIDIFEKFRVYFKQKAHRLIQQHRLCPIKIPNFDHSPISNTKEFFIDKEKLLKEIILDKFHIENTLIPKREVECLFHL